MNALENSPQKATLNPEVEDTFIIEKFAGESRHYAFNLLVRKYQQRVYALARKMLIDHQDADDLTQEVFIKIWHKLDDFRGDAQLFTWIYRITTNECLSVLRKKKLRFLLPIHDLKTELQSKLEGAYFSGEQIDKELQKAILELPDKQRLVFHLKYFEEMDYAQMSDILDTSVGALKASYHHAVKKIEQHLKNFSELNP